MHSMNFCGKSGAITRIELRIEHWIFVVVIHNNAVQDKAILIK